MEASTPFEAPRLGVATGLPTASEILNGGDPDATTEVPFDATSRTPIAPTGTVATP